MLEINEKLYPGDIVRMRKVHPCGGTDWEIVRVGADVGLVCQTCGRRLMLPRRKFARSVRYFVQRGAGAPEEEHPSSRRSTSEQSRESEQKGPYATE